MDNSRIINIICFAMFDPYLQYINDSLFVFILFYDFNIYKLCIFDFINLSLISMIFTQNNDGLMNDSINIFFIFPLANSRKDYLMPC